VKSQIQEFRKIVGELFFFFGLLCRLIRFTRRSRARVI